mgnify:CR=1 FL=1
METVTTIADLRARRARLPSPVGLVPTMGYLHAGHCALIARARAECASVIVTVFVNPTQFGPNEDFARYPRDLQRDLRLLQDEQVDLVFAPEVAEIYPPGFTTEVDVGPIGERLEGASRPGHFRGVATVVTKLFMIVQPHRAYFGWKDAQQVIILQKMVEDLNLPVKIVPLPLVRDHDGLALSSRNTYLSPEERRAALVLKKSLDLAEKLMVEGEREAGRIREKMIELISAEPLARIDYVEIVDLKTLERLETIGDQVLIALAVFIGRTRLIDNLRIVSGGIEK